MSPRKSRLMRGARLCAALVAVVALSACSEETRSELEDSLGDVEAPADGGGEGGSEQPGEGEDPAPSPGDDNGDQAPPPGPENGDQAPPPSEEDGDDSEDMSDGEWVLIVVLGVVAIVLIIAATHASASHSRRKEEERSALDSRVGEIAGHARWLHDQGSVEVLRLTDPQQLGLAWRGTRQHTIDLESSIAALSTQTGDERINQSLRHLGHSVAALRGALDTNVALRLDPAAARTAATLRIN